jgi:hypothetical protein
LELLRCAARKAEALFTAISLLASSPAFFCDTNDLSRFRTKYRPHAELRNFLARVKSEVSVMAIRTLTKQERLVAAILEQTLNGMLETQLTVEDIIDAAAERAQRRRDDATTVQWT